MRLSSRGPAGVLKVPLKRRLVPRRNVSSMMQMKETAARCVRRCVDAYLTDRNGCKGEHCNVMPDMYRLVH